MHGGVEVARSPTCSLFSRAAVFPFVHADLDRATMAGLITLLFGVLWLRRPDRLLGLLTLASALWVVRSTISWSSRCRFKCASGSLRLLPIERRLRHGDDVACRLSGRAKADDIVFGGLHRRWGRSLRRRRAGRDPYLDQYWIPGLIAMARSPGPMP